MLIHLHFSNGGQLLCRCYCLDFYSLYIVFLSLSCIYYITLFYAKQPVVLCQWESFMLR